MANALDFSGQAEPADAHALDFSAGAEPVRTVSAAELAGRQFASGGGDVLNALQKLGDLGNRLIPTPGLIPSGGAHDDVTFGSLASAAHAASDLGSNEVPDGMGANVMGKVARVVPSLAMAIATGGESSLAGAVPAAVRSVPVLGRLAAAIGGGAPTAAALTGVQASNLPDAMSTTDKIKQASQDLGINLAMAGLPAAIGKSLFTRVATGAGIGYGSSAGLSALHGEQQDQAANLAGAVMGGLLGQHGEPRSPEIDPHLSQYANTHDFSAQAEPVLSTVGKAANWMVSKVAPSHARWNPNLDPEAVAAVAADRAAMLGEPAAPPEADPALPAPLRRTGGAIPRGVIDTPAGPGQIQSALPAPVVTVDRAGIAANSAGINAALQNEQAQQQALADQARERQSLGITPDIERTQGTRWAKQGQQVREAEQRKQTLAEIDQQQAALEAANKPSTSMRAPADETADDALTFLAKKGGLARTDFIKQGIDPAETRAAENRRRGGISRPLFRASDGGGMSLDHAAETLWQHGYLHSQDNNAALDLIMGSLRGDPAYSMHRAHQDDLLSLEQQRRDVETQPVDDYADVPFSRKPVDTRTFAGMTREQFLGKPRITANADSNSSDLKPRELRTVATAPAEPFMGGRFEAKFSPDGAVVLDRGKPIASYNFGDTLVVAKSHRRQGIATELATEWRRRFPQEATTKTRTKASQTIQERAWDRLAGKDEPKFSFAGERAHTADRGALAQAQQMEAMGRDSVPDRYGNQPGSPEETHTATGWHRGVDGKWKFEIDDSGATIKDAIALKDQNIYTEKRDALQARMKHVQQGGSADENARLQSKWQALREANQKQLTVADVLDHPALLAAYPGLAAVHVDVMPGMKGLGAYYPSRNRIEIRNPGDYAPTGDGSLKSVLLHEIQHAIQEHEGFARGGSSAEARTLPEFEQALRQHMQQHAGELPAWNEVKPDHPAAIKAARAVYQRLAGEVEARNTQRRMGLNADERRATPPSETADVPRSQQIVRFNADRANAESDHDDLATVSKYNRILSKYIGADVYFTPATGVHDHEAAALAGIDAVLGGRSIVVDNRNRNAIDIDGVTLQDGTRLIDSEATAPLVTVTLHETFHQMEKDDPDLAGQVHDYIRQHGATHAYHAVLQERARQGGEDPERISHQTAVSELSADAVADAMSDPEFLEGMAKRNPGLFRKVAEAIMASLNRVLKHLRRTLGSSSYLDDVQAFRDHLAGIMDKYAERVQAREHAEEAKQPEAMFSRKPPADATDFLQDMPSRRPGEAQGDYLRRITRKNGEEIKAATALVKQQRQLGRMAMRAMEATKARQMAIADAALREARKTFDKTPKVINFASVHQWETGQPIADADFRHFVTTMQSGFDQRIARIQALAPGELQTLIANYMPHLYEDTGKATKWYQNVMGKRPLGGDRSFLKQRTWPTLKEAMESGLKPITDNPVDWVLAKYAQMDKFIGLLELKQHMEQRGWSYQLGTDERVLAGYARVDDPALRNTVVPELIAKDLNNLLAPGLEKYGAWRSLRAMQNTIVSTRLSISAFHAGFTSIDNAVTHGGVGLQRLAMGDIKGGLLALVKALPTMLTSPREGGHLNAQWTGQTKADPHTAALLDLLTLGGARMQMGGGAAEYNNALPKVMRTLRQLQAPGALADRAADAKRYALANGAGKAALVGGWNTIKAAGSTLSAMGEAGSYLIHHWLVPNQKMAARVTLLKFELDRYAHKLGKQRGDYAGIIDAMNPDVAQQLASEVTDKVDFRLGQMTYDNFFYPKIARQMAQLVLMAPGWLAGGIQTAQGGVSGLKSIIKPRKLVGPLDKAGKITDAHRGRFEGDTANLAMLFLMVGGAGALYQWLVAGIEPDSLKDFVAPRTGRRNADGSDERLVAPSYLKDHYELVKHPFATLGHKLNPSLGMLWELAHNADYFGDDIYDPHAKLPQQIHDVAGYLLKGMSPFTVDNVQKSLDNGDSPGQMAANFVGVTNAAASLTRTPFQAFVAKGGEKGWSIPAATPAEAEYRKRQKSAEDAIRQNRTPDLSGMDPADVRKIKRAVQIEKPESQFAKLGLADKLDAYALATPDERKRYDLKRMLLDRDPRRSVTFRRLPETEQRALMRQLQTIAGTPMDTFDN